MATRATPIMKRRDWRTIVFVVLTGLFGLLVVVRAFPDLLAALLLAPYAWRSLIWQFAGVGGEHAAQFHWIESVIISIVLVLAGVLAATKRPGWRALGIIVGLAFVYLGAAALQVPYHDGS